MQLAAWVTREERGAITKLQLRTQLAYSTILRALHGRGITAATARLISEATDGEVSIAELVEAQAPKRAAGAT